MILVKNGKNITIRSCADLSKKPKYIKAIYLYPSERPHNALPENSSFYRFFPDVNKKLQKGYNF